MKQVTEQEIPSWDRCLPHVLVVEQDSDYGHMLVAELQDRSIRAKHIQTVDAFLDLNCRERVDLVSLEIDAMDPNTLDNIKLLRTHFGEGPGTRIVATSSFLPGAFPFLVEQRGADRCMAKPREPEVMAAALETELRKQMKSKEKGWANKLGSRE
ncbi:hypothetical protein [uncultured Tateyamaria sp.]|uniref:hypothetical protein n=1 Tax=uncultured Tateyamaria sp. TaxID=455651 RepID=UPI00262A7819|nr:hypothetical protein [uncultured Tateyamaria sp.]